jgi:phospholipid N-methyltransferase
VKEEAVMSAVAQDFAEILQIRFNSVVFINVQAEQHKCQLHNNNNNNNNKLW